MVFRLYDGLLKVVQWADNKDLRCYNIRCDDLYIIDIDFLQDSGSLEKYLWFSTKFFLSEPDEL